MCLKPELNQTETHALIWESLFKQKISWKIPFKLLNEWLAEKLQTVVFVLEILFLLLLNMTDPGDTFVSRQVYFVCALVMVMCVFRQKTNMKALKSDVSTSSEHRSK